MTITYDGASNVRGQYSGLQSRMREKAEMALYVWCHAHRLNLVIESVLSCSTEISVTLGLLQELYKFFSTYKRHAALVEAQETERYTRTLKRVADTTRSWRSAEDGTNTLLECYDCVINALADLESNATDSNTVMMASNLLKRLDDFEVIVCLFILQTVLSVTGPISRLLQGVSCDFAVAATLIQGCIQTFKDMRNSTDETWKRILLKARDFAKAHDISIEFEMKRKRKVKRMAGEIAVDEQLDSPEDSYKSKVFIKSLDVVLMQLNERFTETNITILHEMHLFAPKYLLSDLPDCTVTCIQNICSFYKLDCTVVVREYSAFRPLYRQMHTLVSVTDLLSKKHVATTTLPDLSDEIETTMNEDNAGDDHDTDTESENISNWADMSFIKPLRAITHLSGFPALSWLYTILVSLAVTSSTAERTMSRIRIIKNRLRTTMLDEWYSSLVIVANEKDILDMIPTDSIIDCFAANSAPLQKLLLTN